MLNVLVTAGGVTTAWHMVKVAKEYFADRVCVHLCDTNAREHVPSAVMADRFYRVPGLIEPGYYEHMLQLMEDNGIQVVVPLIDQDLFTWCADNPDLAARNIRSTGPLRQSAKKLSDKRALYEVLTELDLPSPKIVARDEMLPGREYIVKSAIGCGSQGIFFVRGGDNAQIPEGSIIQERCDGSEYEITAEVFNTPELQRVFCRRRIATKSGVCTKAEPAHIPEITQYIRHLTAHVPCPAAFCAQFFMHGGQWCMIDCNLRLGAGTALSTAAGFQLVRAFWANLCGAEVSEGWLTPDLAVKAVLRVYDELVIR